MGGFGGGLEQIQVEMDARSVQALTLMNTAIADIMEKGVAGSTEKVNRSWQTISETMIRTADKSKNSGRQLHPVIGTPGRGGGESGLDKLNAQMEQSIKNYGYSEQAINKITVAYAKLAEAEKKRTESAGGENSGAKYKELGREHCAICRGSFGGRPGSRRRTARKDWRDWRRGRRRRYSIHGSRSCSLRRGQ